MPNFKKISDSKAEIMAPVTLDLDWIVQVKKSKEQEKANLKARLKEVDAEIDAYTAQIKELKDAGYTETTNLLS